MGISSERRRVNKNKYLVGLIGLAVGFIISFFWTQSINKSGANRGVSASGPQGAASGEMGQQAMMGQVQQVIERAKNNPNDFQAQIEAAKVFNQVGRKDETVDYLKKAYTANPTEFMRQSSADLQGVLPYIAMYYDEKKNYEESDKWIRRALDATPNDSEMRIEFAATYLQREPPQPEKAVQELQAELKSNPKDGHALSHLVEAFALKKDVSGADDSLKKLKEVDPTNQRVPALEKVVSDLKAGRPVSIPKE
jgi:tetratricopeptide (TPR) repeat protein